MRTNRCPQDGETAIDSLVELATQWIDISLLALLAGTAVTVVRMRSLWAAVMLTGIYSFLGASWMLILDAPDVAFTEAAVGAGIATVLMLSTLALTGTTMKEREKSPLLPLSVVVLTGAALVYGTADMPQFGDPAAPVHQHLMPEFMNDTVPSIHDADSNHSVANHHGMMAEVADSNHHDTKSGVGIENVVTAILASYRGYDTLGETVVILTAGVGVMLMLRGNQCVKNHVPERTADSTFTSDPLPPMRQRAILRVVSKLVIPYILLFGLYVQFHGDYGPGGGFQAGVIFASAFILYGLVFGLRSARTVTPPQLIEILIALGVLIFAGTGVTAMLLGGNFLDYSVLGHHLWSGFLPHGQHLGVLLVELGVGITVAAVMITIFFTFSGRERVK